jgi:ABC-type nitrate/sulfonate/bicarbonate transport system substrate-binding protein
VLVVTVLLFLVYLPARADDSLLEVRFQADWLLNGTHAGVLFAQRNGYFEQEGLSVELVPGNGSANALRMLG